MRCNRPVEVYHNVGNGEMLFQIISFFALSYHRIITMISVIINSSGSDIVGKLTPVARRPDFWEKGQDQIVTEMDSQSINLGM